MKKQLLFVVILAVFATKGTFAQYVPDTVKVVKVSTAPIIDGDIDDVWNNAQFTQINYWGKDAEGVEKPTPSESDFKASFKLLWDGEYVYFLGVIVDDNVMDKDAIAAQAAPDWETDCWEYYWAPSNTQYSDMSEMTQIRTAYANSTNDDASSTYGVYSEDGFSVGSFVTAARVLSSDGWIVEAKFELGVLATAVQATNPDFTIEDGSALGFGVMTGDNDDATTRHNIGTWIPNMHWNEADTAGIMLLMPQQDVNVETVETTNINFYPNPVAQKLYISSNTKIGSIEIFNLLGSKVLTVNNTNNQLNVSGLSEGLYMVKFYSKENNLLATRKLLKK